MGNRPRIRRLTLIPSGEDESMRRFRLARLDEVALASPPYELSENGDRPPEEPEPEGDEQERERE
jgi:hypothetical protein